MCPVPHLLLTITFLWSIPAGSRPPAPDTLHHCHPVEAVTLMHQAPARELAGPDLWKVLICPWFSLDGTAGLKVFTSAVNPILPSLVVTGFSPLLRGEGMGDGETETACPCSDSEKALTLEDRREASHLSGPCKKPL